MALVFQDASAALNPLLRVGDQIAEVLPERRLAAHSRALDALRSVRVQDAERVMSSYPFQLSGGMQQRVAIAAALVRRPKVLIADEPTTALDATVQLQILLLLKDLQRSEGMSIVLISHDLGVIATLCTRVYVMYSGEVVEMAGIREIYHEPQHPYTKALLSATLEPADKRRQVDPIPGALPDPANPPPGCRFNPRCPFVMERCRSEVPPLVWTAPKRNVRCWLHMS
jgi:peptide/nickel transport system ATP-binding protein